ncbi:MAG TPA: hypothetical protein VHL58_19810 [Thermoanaerobaculia bacterium]|nr:hypothetical protein [Thermoanaerobaculia bacterium]
MHSSTQRLLRITLAIALGLFSTTILLAAPPARQNGRIVYDAKLDRLVLFGGMTKVDANRNTFQLGDTWEWTGKSWIQIFTAKAPSARSAFAMVYDSARSQEVLFGGTAGLDSDKKPVVLGDTWVFHDQNWSQVNTPSSPPARSLAAAAYDPIRDRVILFGGFNGTTDIFDSWEFDGTTWRETQVAGPQIRDPFMTYDVLRNDVVLLGENSKNESEMYHYVSGAWEKLTPAHLPTCVLLASMAYDTTKNRIVLVNGVCPSGATPQETWIWDGADWTKKDVKILPGQVTGVAMTYDPTRDEVFLFGGGAVDGVLQSIAFRFHDDDWAEVKEELLQPSPRSLFVFEKDPTRGVTWLFGGHDDQTDYYDLWKLQAGKWELITATDPPAGCTYPAGAFDTDRSKLVIVCESGIGYEWDSEKWTKFEPKTRPATRRFSSVVYDPVQKRTILYGGFDGINYQSLTWLWDGTAWKKNTKGNPRPRALTAMFYDPVKQKTFVFGGIGRPTTDDRITRYADMWSFEGTKWLQLKTVPTLPAARYGTMTSIDPASGNILMFGGKSATEQYINEQWLWNGTTWAKIEPAKSPSPRMNLGLTVDPSTGKLTLFGGYAGYFFSELWTFSGSSWTLQVPQ